MADGIRQHALDLLARFRESRPKKEKTDDEEFHNVEDDDDETIDYGQQRPRNTLDDGYETTSTAFSQQFSHVGYDEEEGLVVEDISLCYTTEDEASIIQSPSITSNDIKENDEATRMNALKVLNMVGDYDKTQPLSLEAGNQYHPQSPSNSRTTKRVTTTSEELDNCHTPQQQLRTRRRMEKQQNDNSHQQWNLIDQEDQQQFDKKNSSHHLRSTRFSTKARLLSRHLHTRFSRFDETLRMVLVISGSVILAGCVYYWL